MEDFAALINTVVSLMKLEMSIWGFSFSFWHIMLFGMLAGILIWFLGGYFDA